MSLLFDFPRRLRAHKIALFCEQRIEAGSWGAGKLHFHGGKAPVAVLVASGTELRAYDLSGRPLDPEVLDAACPGLVRAMTGDGMP